MSSLLLLFFLLFVGESSLQSSDFVLKDVFLGESGPSATLGSVLLGDDGVLDCDPESVNFDVSGSLWNRGDDRFDPFSFEGTSTLAGIAEGLLDQGEAEESSTDFHKESPDPHGPSLCNRKIDHHLEPVDSLQSILRGLREKTKSSAMCAERVSFEKELTPNGVDDVIDTFRNDRRDKIVSGLNDQRFVSFSIPELFSAVGVPYQESQGSSRYLRDVLRLTLDGVPIDYDKKHKKITMRDKSFVVGVPPEGTNLATFTYDLVCLYGHGISQEELGHFAYRKGYWHQSRHLHKTYRAHFYELIVRYKKFCFILGYIGERAFSSVMREKVKPLLPLWDQVKKDDGCVNNLGYYRSRCIMVDSKDLGLIHDFKGFLGSDEFVVLKNYVAKYNKDKISWLATESPQDFIKKVVMEESRSSADLWALCTFVGMSSADIWPALRELMVGSCKGHFVYHCAQREFCWHEEQIDTSRLNEDYTVRAFDLLSQFPDVSRALKLRVLWQEGFTFLTKSDWDVVIKSLEILGMVPSRQHLGSLSGQRELLNSMLRTHCQKTCEGEYPNLTEWDVRACKKIFLWVQKGHIVDLWKAYVSTRDPVASSHEDMSDCDQQGSACKRRRTLKTFDAEKIVREDIPDLYKFLCKKNVWRGSCVFVHGAQ